MDYKLKQFFISEVKVNPVFANFVNSLDFICRTINLISYRADSKYNMEQKVLWGKIVFCVTYTIDDFWKNKFFLSGMESFRCKELSVSMRLASWKYLCSSLLLKSYG